MDTSELYQHLGGQLPAAYTGYSEVLATLNSFRGPRRGAAPYIQKAALDLFEYEFTSWLTSPRIAYAINFLMANPNQNLIVVGVPNTFIDAFQISEVAGGFDKGNLTLLSSTAMSGNDRKAAWIHYWYTSEELSGTSPEDGRSVNFCLIPDQPDERFTGWLPELRATMEQIQTANSVALATPTILEAVTFWHVLRAQGAKTDLASTTITHISLPDKNFWGPTVPQSFVTVTGTPCLEAASLPKRRQVRLAVR